MKAYGLAVVTAVAGVALTRLTWPFFSPAPFAPVFGAVAVSAHWGNARAGLLAALLASAGLALAGPAATYRWSAPSLIVFTIIAVLGSRMIAGRNRLVADLRASENDLRATLAHVRESESKLRRAQKMEAVGQLAAGVAHNFNNLLQVTMGYTDILMDARRDAALDAMAIAEIRSATERGAALTRQLLAFGRQHDARVARVDVDTTMNALREMLTRVIREDIVLTFEFESRGAVILIDPNDLEQAVINLVINARDAMPDGGRIHVAVTRMMVDESTRPADTAAVTGEYVRVSVRDTGTGMAPEIVARLFEPFFTTKDVGSGTGLGLPFVDGIARHAGGFVTVETEPGKGTTMSIVLPMAAPGARAPMPLPPMPAPRRTPRTVTILVVEDEEGVRAATARILSHAGYRVLAAETAIEAAEIFEKEPSAIDLLLTDIVMPDMPGPELAERLLLARPDLPVLFMSGYSEMSPASVTATAQMAFVPKPFNAASLVATVERLLVTA